MAPIGAGGEARINMPAQRRLWDSSVIIGYLAGYSDLAYPCNNIIALAERGEVEIVVSAMATVEVAYLQGVDDQISEAMIRELFDREYIIPAAIDVRVAAIARELVRKYRSRPSLKPPDATHLATAIQLKISLVESTDTDLLRLDGLEGSPAITVRRPLYEGHPRMPGL